MERVISIAGCLAIALFAGCGSSDDNRSSTPNDDRPRDARRPSSTPQPGPGTRDGDRSHDLPRPGQSLKELPPSVQRRLRAEARRAQRITPSVRLGCERYVPTGTREAELGPPPPRVHAARRGETVTVTYSVKRLSASVACRPFALEIAVSDAARREIPNTEILRTARSGTVTLPVPAPGRSFVVGARTRTLAGRPSDLVLTRVR